MTGDLQIVYVMPKIETKTDSVMDTKLFCWQNVAQNKV